MTKSMKRLLCVLLVILTIALTACGSQPAARSVTSTPAPTAKPTPRPTPRPTLVPTPEVFDARKVPLTATPNSTCFSEVGYSSKFSTLVVVFRDSGAMYCYYDFSSSDWSSFKNAASLGKYYNSYIKGKYTCDRIY